jgi:hypothetical protein
LQKIEKSLTPSGVTKFFVVFCDFAERFVTGMAIHSSLSFRFILFLALFFLGFFSEFFFLSILSFPFSLFLVFFASDDNDSIQHSTQNGHVEVVQLLMADPRVDPSANDNYAIRGACAMDWPCRLTRELILPPTTRIRFELLSIVVMLK